MTEFCVTWDSYLNQVSKGITCLQQNAEFVDMTLAAGGHLVKVHQNIIAVASPYLKAMLQSASCQHPVIFLNNISHEILSYILEYIYTGEVKVPTNIITKFLKACKSLCIRGIDSIIAPKAAETDTMEREENEGKNDVVAHISIATQDNYHDLDPEPAGPQETNYNISNSEVTLPAASSLEPPSVSLSNENKDSGNVSQQLDYDPATRTVDINSISNFVILKPKTCTYPRTELNIHQTNTSDQILNGNGKNKSINIISDVRINTNDFTTDTNNLKMNLCTNPIEGPINVSLNPDDWQNNPTEINPFITLNAEPLGNLPKLTLITGDWQPENFQTSLPMEVDTNLVDHTQNVDNWQLDPRHSNTHIEVNKDSNRKVAGGNRNIPIAIYRKISASVNRKKNITCIKGDTKNITLSKEDRIKMDKSPHYTISNRGSLQLILKRFLYYSHHHSQGGTKRRWRCINYRKMHCPAFVDTDHENITQTSEYHDHPNHENQIRKKIKSNIVFTSLTKAEEFINESLNETKDIETNIRDS